VGLAEAATLAWAEDGARVSARKMRGVLKSALLAIVADRTD
jgi:hypothetical protein